MNSILPPAPNIIFTVLEPLSLVAGFIGATLNPQYFMNQQLPNTSANQKTTPSAIVTCMQLGNVYLLLGMCAVGVLWQTTDVKVLRNYVVALAIADIGHLYITYVVMGQAFFDVMGWNTTAAGNIGITVFLFLTRSAYLLGLLGKNRGQNKRVRKRA
ncbi:MAG: hypothetical protein M1824_000750 [Vezdaea acicularis]|nr:MAG: hypothetical protein M1824_000750 [Vezdaea acicularis]